MPEERTQQEAGAPPKVRMNRSPAYVAAFLIIVSVPQFLALFQQFRLGFRPFGRAAVRVPLSWDMFAGSIERCSLDWTPAVNTPLGRLRSLRDISPPLEWDVVADSARTYKLWALWGCRYSQGATKADLRCFYPNGKEARIAFDCP